jgi:hypothetical protein
LLLIAHACVPYIARQYLCTQYVWPQPTKRNTRFQSLDIATVSANSNTLNAL